jgi:serine/threonine-protein kinase
MASLCAGGLLADRYRLIDQIGVGGMSVVWRAHDEVLERIVAVKVLADTLAADVKFRHMVRAEARAAAQLVHPHITAVHDYGEELSHDGTVTAFVVMELVTGEELGDRLTAGPLPWPEAVDVCAQVADALAAAHRIGIVHRDVTPANVMLTATGAKVLDFGIATRIGAPDHDDTGGTFGTPAYLAPERLDNHPAQPATDTYALGVLLFEMLTGQPPYPADTWDDLVAALQRGVPPLTGVPGLPPAVAETGRRCLSREPNERPTADQVGAVLRAHGSARGRPTPLHLPTLLLPVTTVELPPHPQVTGIAGHRRPVHRRPVRPLPVAAVAIVALSAAVLFGLSLRPQADRTPQALTPTVLLQPNAPLVFPETAEAPDGGTAANPPPSRAGDPEAGDPEDDRKPNRNVVPGPPARTLDKAVDDFTDLVVEGLAVGAITGDVAHDLTQTAGNLGATLRNGTTGGRDAVRDVRRKLKDRAREGSISEKYEDLLDGALDRINEIA